MFYIYKKSIQFLPSNNFFSDFKRKKEEHNLKQEKKNNISNFN